MVLRLCTLSLFLSLPVCLFLCLSPSLPLSLPLSTVLTGNRAQKALSCSPNPLVKTLRHGLVQLLGLALNLLSPLSLAERLDHGCHQARLLPLS